MDFTRIIEQKDKLQTPLFYYDLEILKATLDAASKEATKYGYHVHYALKANANHKILEIIKNAGFGADCVSGNEVLRAVEVGFKKEDIVFAGVGKTDKEINDALDADIFCFNIESIEELNVINELAVTKGKTARIALRINPNVNANTHHYITTGLDENKFGINLWELEHLLTVLGKCENIELTGIHFHIGSQINDLSAFKSLCLRVNTIQEWFINHNLIIPHINVGGGLGVDYYKPDENLIPDFETFFAIFKEHLDLRPHQQLHFELGRSLVAQCGTLFTRVLYVKKGIKSNFMIVDAGMTELIRPALYQSYHKVENITPHEGTEKYDVVGPICESSDSFGKAVTMPTTKRGDLIAIRTTAAYGEVMASQYNLRDKAAVLYSDEL